MAKAQFLYILIPALLLLTVFILFSYRKDRPLYRLFKEAQHCEDEGEYLAAIEIYELILEQYRHLKFKDGKMIKHVIQKLKQLHSKHTPKNNPPQNIQGARLFIRN